MEQNTALRTQALDLLRFPLAIVVLAIHVFTPDDIYVGGQAIQVTSYPVYMLVLNIINGFLRGQSVPIYFFISGFVFFLGFELTKASYTRKLRNRAKSLLIPYIIWNAIAVAFVLFRFIPGLSRFVADSNVEVDFSLPHILSCFWIYRGDLIPMADASLNDLSGSLYPINVPLWFVRDLMIVVLTTPLLYVLVKKFSSLFVAALGVAWFSMTFFDLGLVNSFLKAYFFFTWGAYMSINKKDMLAEFGRFAKPSYVLYPMLALSYIWAAYCHPSWLPTIKNVNVIAGLFFAYNLAAWLLRSKRCKVNPGIAASSFFVYIAHYLFCSRIVKMLFALVKPDNDCMVLAVFTLSLLLVLAILLVSFYTLKRFAPTFLKVVAGRK